MATKKIQASFFLFVSLTYFGNLYAQTTGQLSACSGGDRSQWSGCIGTYSYNDGPRAGRIYTGPWVNGKANGVGVSIGRPGTRYARYEGEFVDDIPDGKGKIISSNGDVYEGEIKSGVPNGVGTFYWHGDTEFKGYKYVGEWRAGKKSGKGALSGKGFLYNGEFNNDLYEGAGSVIESNGEEYSGQFKGGKLNGMGKTQLANGDRYVGEFKDNKYHGQGAYYFRDPKLKPDSGLWVEGRFMGEQPSRPDSGAGIVAESGRGQTSQTGFQDCDVKTNTNLSKRELDKTAPEIVGTFQNGDKLSFGFSGAAFMSKMPLTDEKLKLLEINKTMHSEVLDAFEKPISTVKASGKIISTYMSARTELSVDPRMFLPIIGGLFMQGKNQAAIRTVYLIFDEATQVLVGCKKTDLNSATEAPRVFDMLKSITVE